MRGLHKNIINIVYDEALSISEIYRRLSARGIKINRLVLTGYLRAMEELGELENVRDRNSRNAKKYIYRKKKSFYKRIGELIAELDRSDEEKNEISLYVLHKIFRRPIFRTEIRLCGFSVPSSAIKITGEERKKAYEKVRKKVDVRPREGAYLPSKDYPEEYFEITSRLITQFMEGEGL